MFVEKEQASSVVRQKRAAGELTLIQLERYQTLSLTTCCFNGTPHVLIGFLSFPNRFPFLAA